MNSVLQKLGISRFGTLKDEGYPFFLKSKDEGDSREHGIGFVIQNMLLCVVQMSIDATE